ncbi:MAG: ATP-binding cassette domain-containing protein [Burkholderiaceae bacterium]
MTATGLSIEGRLMLAARELLPPFSLTLDGGRWHALLGPSGVGKSSLIRTIAGLPGSVRLDGRCSAHDGESLRGRVAWMAQSDSLAPWLTVLDNLLLPARLAGGRGDKPRAREMLAAVGLAEHGHKKPPALSGGMRQRVALARTLMLGCEIVLLDEPFSALDAGTRARMQDLAVQCLRGKTVVIVTHDPAEAVRVGDTLTLMTAAGLERLEPPPGAPVRALDAAEVLAVQGDLWRRLHGLAAA